MHFRTGIVLADSGGALRKLLPLFKLGVGGRFGSGRQWMSWISLADELGAIEHLMASDVTGPVNLTAPGPVTNNEFVKTLGRVLHRPAVVPVPRFGPSLIVGREAAETLLYTGQRVLPKVLQSDGYEFAHPELETALRAVLRWVIRDNRSRRAWPCGCRRGSTGGPRCPSGPHPRWAFATC